jgi:hypothetical protein
MRLAKRTQPVPDGYLTYFTAEQADELRRLVARSFAAVGRDVDGHSDRVVDRSGTTIGLWNIGAMCLRADEAAWPQLIDEHVRLIATPARDLSDVTEAEFGTGLSLRLVDEEAVPDPDALGYARVVVPGLLEVLAVDLGDAVATPSREDLTGRGTIAGLVALGRANLRGLLDSDTVRSGTVGENGRFTAVRGESLFTASLALVLPEAMGRFSGEDDWGRGVLVAVPSRHELLYRTIDAADARLALQYMLEAAFLGFDDEIGPLSPDVFWVRKHKWVPVTSCAGGKPRVLRGTGLREALAGF